MYINDISWQGYLCEDAKRIEPRHEGDAVLALFRVAQFMPTRRGANIEEKAMRLECKARWDLTRANALVPKLVKGTQVYIKGALDIEHRDTEQGPRTYISVLVNSVQFFPKPMRSEQPTSTSSDTATPAPVSAVEVHKDAFNPARFDD